MRRAHPACALLTLLLLSALAPTLTAQSAGGTLIISNARFDQVQVEVRLGSSSDCAANPSVGTRTLTRNQRWAIVSARVVCWRREAVPGNQAAGWTDWTSARASAPTRREVTL
jgi:hypothetical protein